MAQPATPIPVSASGPSPAAQPQLRAAVITVSDSVFQGKKRDGSGAAVSDVLQQSGWTVAHSRVVNDDMAVIAATLRELSSKGFELIVTTGGTGIAARDGRIEASFTSSRSAFARRGRESTASTSALSNGSATIHLRSAHARPARGRARRSSGRPPSATRCCAASIAARNEPKWQTPTARRPSRMGLGAASVRARDAA